MPPGLGLPVPALGHNWTGWTTLAATCTDGGYDHRTCKRCGETETDNAVDALGHDWTEWTTVPPTCTDDGYDYRTCNRCDLEDKQNEVAALGGEHEWNTSNYRCNRCNSTAPTVTYKAADGSEPSTLAIPISGSGNVTLGNSSYNGWYAVSSDVSLTKLTFHDKTVNLILCDGATLTIDTSTLPQPQTDGIELSQPMNIYGQTGGMGRLVINAGNAGIWSTKALSIYGGTITATGRASNGIQANGNLTIAGGTISGTSTLNGNGIYSMSTLSITGGNVTATGGTGKDGMYGYNGITLSWTGMSDKIKASSYGGTVTLAKSFIGSDGNSYPSGSVADASVLNDVTLTGTNILYDTADNDVADIAGTTNVSLYGRTIYCDGDWNTLCLPFDVGDLDGTPLEGAAIKELDGSTSNLSGGTLTLNFKDATSIEAGKPYIVKKLHFADDAPLAKFTITDGNSNSYLKLMDGGTDYSWNGGTRYTPAYVEFHSDATVGIVGYTLTNDVVSERDPKVWTLQAKVNADDEWTIIDSRNAYENSDDALPASRLTSKSYNVQQPGYYQYFRFEVTAVDHYLGYMTIAELSMHAYSPNDISHLTNPVFENVTVSTDAPVSVASSDGAVSFVGSYNPVSISGEDKGMLYLGAGNTLYYPNAAMTIGSCRALFRLGEGITAGDPTSPNNVRAFVLNFGESSGGATSLSEELRVKSEKFATAAWYSLDGRKLSGKPTAKGVYIHNGKKLVIKGSPGDRHTRGTPEKRIEAGQIYDFTMSAAE